MRTLAFIAAALFLALPAFGQGVGGAALKLRYEAAAATLSREVAAEREKLDQAYDSRLASLATASKDKALAAAYEQERVRFSSGKNEPAPLEEIGKLREQYDAAADRLGKSGTGRTAALAAAYLFRLCALGENAFAEGEHTRLAGSIEFDQAELGRTDLVAVADAFTRSGSYETKHYGELDHLMVRRAPDGGSSRYGYLRFDLSGLGRRVSDARLRLVCTGNYQSAADDHELAIAGTDKRWKETTLTFATRPATLDLVAHWKAPQQGGVVYVDVTKWINAGLAANARTLELRIAGGGNYISYGAREHANPWARPVLMIDDAGAALAVDGSGALPPSEVFGVGASEGAVASAGTPAATGTPVEMNQAAPEKDLPLKGSIKQVKALLVQQLPGGGMAGFAQPLTGTAVKSGGTEAMEIKFNQNVGDDMKTALRAVVRGLQLRYGAWPHGYAAELGFEEKYDPKDGPSAAVACALLIDALVHDHQIDPVFAVTGDLNSDLSVQPVGGVPAKIRGATARGAKVIAVPLGNRRDLEDLAILGELKPFADIAVFTAETFDQARDLALAERPPELAASLADFARLQAAGAGAVRETEGIAALQAIVERSPHFLSAELIHRSVTGRLPKTLSLAGSFDAIDTNITPFIEAILGGRGKSINGTDFASTMEALRLVRPKLDRRVHALHTALVDLIVFDRRHIDKKFGNETQYQTAVREQKTLAARYRSERDALRANPEIIEELER